MGCHLSSLAESSRLSHTPLAKGRLHGSFHQKYVLGSPLGTGSFGEVKTCTTKRHANRGLAVKIMPKQRRRSSQGNVNRVDVREMFRSEASILRGLDHTNIVKIHDACEDSTNCYLVMDRCDGGELFTHIAAKRVFTEGHAALICRQMLAALKYIHQRRIVHRDIKAENFVFTDDSDKSKIVLVDFGMAVKLSKNDSYLRQVCGSPHYVAPELLKGRYQWQVDLWALGVILYLMLYGQYPFEAGSHRGILRKALLSEPNYVSAGQPPSPAAVDLLRSLLCKNPANRLSAAEALCHPWVQATGSPLLRRPIAEALIFDAQRRALADRREDVQGGEGKEPERSISYQPDKAEVEDENQEANTNVLRVTDELARLPTGSRTLSSAIWDDTLRREERSGGDDDDDVDVVFLESPRYRFMPSSEQSRKAEEAASPPVAVW